jgi:hypothetical protein
MTKNHPNPKPMTGELKKSFNSLIWVWFSYGGGVHSPDSSKPASSGDVIYLPHNCGSSGEDAAAMLWEYGLAVDAAWGCVLTDAGISVMIEEFDY